MAMFYLNMSKMINVRNVCDKVTEENYVMVKARFYQGKAHLKEFELAKEDFDKTSCLAPDNQQLNVTIVYVHQ